MDLYDYKPQLALQSGNATYELPATEATVDSITPNSQLVSTFNH